MAKNKTVPSGEGAPGSDTPSDSELKGLLVLTCGIVCAVLTVVALRGVESVFRPFFVALFLALLVRPAVTYVIRQAGGRIAGYTLVACILFGFFSIGGRIVSRDLARFESQRSVYTANLIGYRDRITESLAGSRFARFMPDDEALSALVDPSLMAKWIGASTYVFFDFIGGLLVVLVFMLLILMELERLPVRLERAYGAGQASRIMAVVHDVSMGVQRYVVLKVLVSGVTALMAWLVMAMFDLDYAITLATIVFLFNFIPYVGSVVATAAPALVALVQFATPWNALWIVLILTTLQQLVGNVVEPKIQGEGLRVAPVVILLALAFWGWMWGISGMILSVPIAATLRIVLEQFKPTRRLAILMSDVGTEGRPQEAAAPGRRAK